MDILRIMIGALVGTTMMTIFSYLISVGFQKLYKEPVLLKYVLLKSGTSLTKKETAAGGWILHYAIGILFIAIYHFLWKLDIVALSWINGLMLGIASGVVGVLGWFIMFKISEFKSDIDFAGYYIQLLFAHIIFALSAVAVYKFLLDC